VSLENAGGAAKRVIGVLNSTSSSTDLVCFQTSASRYHGGGPIALYAQSLPDSSAGLSHVVGRLTIDYDVRPVTSSSHVTGQCVLIHSTLVSGDVTGGGVRKAIAPRFPPTFCAVEKSSGIFLWEKLSSQREEFGAKSPHFGEI